MIVYLSTKTSTGMTPSWNPLSLVAFILINLTKIYVRWNFSLTIGSCLKKIVATHHVVPIPAYDMHGNLIKPYRYFVKLEGAVVKLHFEFRHWSICEKENEPNFDRYIADVMQIHGIILPKPWVVTPMKHKIFNWIDLLKSPTKKSCHWM